MKITMWWESKEVYMTALRCEKERLDRIILINKFIWLRYSAKKNLLNQIIWINMFI